MALAVGERIDARAEAVGHKHSERVLPMVQALLSAHALRLADCDAIAFGAGPGAFTGLRIACGIAQGLAFGAGKPVVAVGNLQALALAALREVPDARRILTAFDARMQEVYWAVYAAADGGLSEIVAPSLAAISDLPALCRRHEPNLVAGNALRLQTETTWRFADRLLPEATAGAEQTAALARLSLAAGRAVAPAEAAPVYVRDRVALTIEERRAVAAAAAR